MSLALVVNVGKTSTWHCSLLKEPLVATEGIPEFNGTLVEKDT